MRADGFHVGLDLVLGEELAFGGFETGIANAAGGPARHRDGMMPQLLEPAQRQQRHQMADMQAVGGRVKATV